MTSRRRKGRGRVERQEGRSERGEGEAEEEEEERDGEEREERRGRDGTMHKLLTLRDFSGDWMMAGLETISVTFWTSGAGLPMENSEVTPKAFCSYM